MKKMIELENKIQEYEKKNEKTNNDTVNNFQNQINKMDHEIKE